ncbi:hypothetical protein J2X20_003907 [Pelomonas saccharophila]|uniref:DUF4145 domain-containing protein n=1 Tax=Roseateles saccharophilus TaxID=304 RepID=A0ABU1YQV2_ROSSA|nr:hypothetical protein [Roseateles saccharophilus]MDR7271239.1 hypothetical protein [Roseateles saccharophilus]
MLRLSLAFFYNMGSAMKPIAHMRGDSKLGMAWKPLWTAKKALEDLLSSQWFTPAIRAATIPATELHTAIKALTDRTDFESEIGVMQAAEVISALESFEKVVSSELHIADAYFVTRKAGYDTSVLVMNAEENFPSQLSLKVPLAIVDVREAGKCLAFELPTAAGFHIFRAVESVVRSYWDAVRGSHPHPKNQGLGSYLGLLTKHGLGDAKVLAVLTQLKDLHRNPIAHPQVTLTVEEAVSIFGIAQSAVSAMLKTIPERSPEPIG